MTEPLKLFDFQQEAVDKLAKQKARLLGDDMGLGKTIQAIRIDPENRKADQAEATNPERSRLKTLIVAPKSVLPSWQAALEQEGVGPVYIIDAKNRTPFERPPPGTEKKHKHTPLPRRRLPPHH